MNAAKGSHQAPVEQPLIQSRVAIVTFGAIVCVLIVCATVLIMAGKSAGDLFTVLGTAAVPIAVGLLALVRADTAHTKTLANGNLSELRQDVMELARMLAASPAMSGAAEPVNGSVKSLMERGVRQSQ